MEIEPRYNVVKADQNTFEHEMLKSGLSLENAYKFQENYSRQKQQDFLEAERLKRAERGESYVRRTYTQFDKHGHFTGDFLIIQFAGYSGLSQSQN